MKLLRVILRSGLSTPSRQQLYAVRSLSTSVNSGNAVRDMQSSNTFESEDVFERRIFGPTSSTDSFYQKLERLEKDNNDLGYIFNKGNKAHSMDGLDDSFSRLSDGMDRKLEERAKYFDFNPEEINEDPNYAFRPDVKFMPPGSYMPKDLDLTKPGMRRQFKRNEFEVTTAEVLKKADFRNVRFLANFITEAGIIIKRSQTKISAKAQRKVAREIKTARSFGLMPYTSMGTKAFQYGKSMEPREDDFSYETYDQTDADAF